ncbi:MAG: tyrosine-type recombinase/integrase [Myxococcota bacterium]
MIPRDRFPNSLRNALARIDALIAAHATLVLEDDASVLATYLGYCRDERLLTPQSLRQQYYELAYMQRWFRAQGRSLPKGTTTQDIRAFLDFQRDERGNSLVQLRHYLGTLRSVFRWLVDRQVLDLDPTADLALRTPPIRNVHDVLDRDELLRLLQAARDDRDEAPPRFRAIRTRDAALISLFAATGCRLSEALGLTRERLDLQARSAFLPGKGDHRYAVKERVLPLVDDDAVDDIRRWLAMGPENPSAPVFATPSGSIVEPHSVYARLRRVARRAGLERRVTPHALRATFASRLVANGIDPVALQQLMGHAQLATTLTLYAKLDHRSLHDAWLRHNPLAPAEDDDE